MIDANLLWRQWRSTENTCRFRTCWHAPCSWYIYRLIYHNKFKPNIEIHITYSIISWLGWMTWCRCFLNGRYHGRYPNICCWARKGLYFINKRLRFAPRCFKHFPHTYSGSKWMKGWYFFRVLATFDRKDLTYLTITQQVQEFKVTIWFKNILDFQIFPGYTPKV